MRLPHTRPTSFESHAVRECLEKADVYRIVVDDQDMAWFSRVSGVSIPLRITLCQCAAHAKCGRHESDSKKCPAENENPVLYNCDID